MSALSSTGAIVVAAGSSARLRGADKLFAPLAGRPLLAHVLSRFQESPTVDRIALVLSSENLERGRDLVAEYGMIKISPICLGGPRRQDSVRLGLEALGECDWVLVHDGARLLVNPLISEGLEAAQETGAAVPAVPITDTVKSAGPDGTVDHTLDRGRLGPPRPLRSFVMTSCSAPTGRSAPTLRLRSGQAIRTTPPCWRRWGCRSSYTWARP